MKLSITLKDLIYKYNGNIIVESNDIGSIVKEIEIIRSGSKIEGFIFRPGFADSIEFKEYTEKDWQAIYAQWSLTFGWNKIYEFITGENPKHILDDYLKDSVFKNISPLITEEKPPVVKQLDYIYELGKNLMQSKIVLNQHQKDILNNFPDDILKEVYIDSNIKIREIRTMIIAKFINDKTFNPFKNVSDIIPILVQNFSFNSNHEVTPNKTLLKEVKIKVPTNIKRKVIETLIQNKYSNEATNNFKKYQDFWKKVLKQIIIKNFDKTIKLYPEFKIVHEIIYSNKVKTNNTLIENFRKEGLLEESFIEEMKNPGNMLRNLMFYIRNKEGDSYPVKTKKIIKPKIYEENVFTLKDVLNGKIPVNEIKQKVCLQQEKIKVKTDIKNIIDSQMFLNTLTKCNPKLLIQVKGLLKDSKYEEPLNFKFMNKKRVEYSKPVPAIKKLWAKKIIEKIDEAYQIIKKENNKKLGKVYIDENLKNIKVTFTGRIDTDINTSGVFLPIGSKIKLDNILDDDMILRYGVSWKSPETTPDLSICIDPSLNIINGQNKDVIVNWQSPTLYDGNEIIVTSSGDITDCNVNTWSTELMDIDTQKMYNIGNSKMFTTVINYHYPKGSLGQVDTHIFFNLIKKENRILSGRKISVALDEMQYSYKIIDDTQSQIGLLIDLDDKSIEVLKIPFDSISTSSTADGLHSKFLELINQRPKLENAYDTLLKAIDETQIVITPEESDLILNSKTDSSLFTDIIF